MVKKYLKWIILALVLILGIVYFAFLSLINPIVSIIMAYMGIAVFRKRLIDRGVEINEVNNLTELDKIREQNSTKKN